VALKFTSLAYLLQINGDSGVSGETVCEAPVHAGLADPTGTTCLSPLNLTSGDTGDTLLLGGDTGTEHSCGLPQVDPTAPTVPCPKQGLVEAVLMRGLQPHEGHAKAPLAPMPAGSLVAASQTTDWIASDRAYQSHLWTCETCISAGLGYGMRCDIGAPLWRSYSD
jgi:hypothetical protein